MCAGPPRGTEVSGNWWEACHGGFIAVLCFYLLRTFRSLPQREQTRVAEAGQAWESRDGGGDTCEGEDAANRK